MHRSTRYTISAKETSRCSISSRQSGVLTVQTAFAFMPRPVYFPPRRRRGGVAGAIRGGHHMFGRIAPGPRPAAYLIALLIALGVVAAGACRRRLRRSGRCPRRRPVRRSAAREVPRHAAGAEGRPRGAHSQGARRRQGDGEPRVPEASRRQARRLRAEASRRDTGRIGPVALRHGVQRHDRRRAARPAGRDPAASERRLGDGDIRARTGARREPGAARPADALERAAVEPARRRERRPRRADRLRRQRTASVLQRRRLHRARRLPEGAARLRRRSHRPLRSRPTRTTR